jgi:hypothetical protein
MAIRSLAMVTVGSKTFLRLAVRPNIGWDNEGFVSVFAGGKSKMSD